MDTPPLSLVARREQRPLLAERTSQLTGRSRWRAGHSEYSEYGSGPGEVAGSRKLPLDYSFNLLQRLYRPASLAL
jgi:hypothetical protein